MTCPAYCCVASLYCLQKSMMLTPCWPRAVPTGGAGVAWPALIWSFTAARIFFFDAIPHHLLRSQRLRTRPASLPHVDRSDLRDLVEGQLDRRLPVEDVDQDLQPRLVGVDLVDRAVEVGERTGRDANDVAFLETE